MFTVKNTQANVVKLKLLEQVPLSSDERLKVGREAETETEKMTGRMEKQGETEIDQYSL